MWSPQMLGYDQFDALAERLLGRIAEQPGTGRVPANDRPRVVGTDDSVGDLIENPLGQFRLLFHGCTSGLELIGRANHEQPNDENRPFLRPSGLPRSGLGRLYNTISGGTDMGLSICRSVILTVASCGNGLPDAVSQLTWPDAERELTTPFQASRWTGGPREHIV